MPPPVPRLLLIDLSRSAALLGMAVYHLTWDLALFGFIPPGTLRETFWMMFARLVAGSFLFLAGASLWLAHGQGIRWRAFGRRLGILAFAALCVSVASYAFAPAQFIYFGILHSIAAASVIGLGALRLPAGFTLALAAAVLMAPQVVALPGTAPYALAWTGLWQAAPASLDFEPILPWLAPLLAGIATGRLASRMGLWQRCATWRGGALARLLAWPGRHSLAVYLVHQPVLVALVWVAAQVW